MSNKSSNKGSAMEIDETPMTLGNQDDMNLYLDTARFKDFIIRAIEELRVHKKNALINQLFTNIYLSIYLLN